MVRKLMVYKEIRKFVVVGSIEFRNVLVGVTESKLEFLLLSRCIKPADILDWSDCFYCFARLK